MPDIPALPFDIIPPPVPAPLPVDTTWYIAGGAALALGLLALALRHAWRTRHRRHGQRTLRAAEAAFHKNELTARDAAFAIAGALMTGFQTRQLRANANGDAAWADFVARLDTLRYTTQTTDAAPLFAQAHRWLKRKHAPC